MGIRREDTHHGHPETIFSKCSGGCVFRKVHGPWILEERSTQGKDNISLSADSYGIT